MVALKNSISKKAQEPFFPKKLGVRIRELNEKFNQRLWEIQERRHVTPPGRLLAPALSLEPVCDCWKELAEIKDTVLKELFSFSKELTNSAFRISWPGSKKRERAQVRGLLLDQAQLVEKYFWVRLYERFPELKDHLRSQIHLCLGWRIVIHSYRSGGHQKARSRSACLCPEKA